MEAHNVAIPEDADSDVLTDMQNRIEELEGKQAAFNAALRQLTNAVGAKGAAEGYFLKHISITSITMFGKI